MSVVSAAGALLWMTHTLLQEHAWVGQGLETDTNRLRRLESFSGDVNLLPAQRYQLSEKAKEDADVHVRALLVGSKLFVHFVSSAKSVQLSLKVSEYVKPRERDDGEQGRVRYTDKWRCNVEILRWRLERNLFPEFSSDASLVASDAELSRLPEPLLVRVGGFLSVPDFCRVTQTSKTTRRSNLLQTQKLSTFLTGATRNGGRHGTNMTVSVNVSFMSICVISRVTGGVGECQYFHYTSPCLHPSYRLEKTHCPFDRPTVLVYLTMTMKRCEIRLVFASIR
ncbi:hypothetical protein JG687_00007902 [Phytophthora cactorum]|uniref:F-box domain-containing protein n=1 Tax=Phytophthora cactorum TaxID=29920 RepID=A0A8T1UJ31_9STRA|nr:hypothetical protein JG687_00007902 [Phytophthora cactorum]